MYAHATDYEEFSKTARYKIGRATDCEELSNIGHATDNEEFSKTVHVTD